MRSMSDQNKQAFAEVVGRILAARDPVGAANG